jgi:hypothetical protein
MRADVALAWLWQHEPCRAKNLEQHDALERLVHRGYAVAVIDRVYGPKDVHGTPEPDKVYHLTASGRVAAEAAEKDD